MRPIIEVFPVPSIPSGYGVFKCVHSVMSFTGENAKDEAWDYAENLLSDLRYEAERAR